MSTKYLKIYQQLREEILHQDTPSNAQLPDEISLTKKFHCSRMTVKKALDMLVDEGLIYRKRGQGTFIMPQVEQKHKIIVPERDIQGLTKISKQSHAQVRSEIIHFKLEFATKSISEKLQIPESSPIYNIFRLRIIDDKPYVLEQTYMSTGLISGITEEILHHSIYSYIENTLKLRIASAMKILRASISTESDQKYLHLSPTEPIFEVEQIAYLDNGTPFEYSISRHRYDLFEFSSYGLKKS